MTDTTTPTPLERLEAWRLAGPDRDYNIHRRRIRIYIVDLVIAGVLVISVEARTPDAAILAALEQVKGGTE